MVYLFSSVKQNFLFCKQIVMQAKKCFFEKISGRGLIKNNSHNFYKQLLLYFYQMPLKL
jgi:hypothetical protein